MYDEDSKIPQLAKSQVNVLSQILTAWCGYSYSYSYIKILMTAATTTV
jgi:hypothetical protein